MNEEFDNTNRGACWPNRSKRSDNSPDYTGRMDVDGVEYWVNMWLDPGAGGNKPPITFSVKIKEVQPSEQESGWGGINKIQDIKDLAAGPDTPQPDKPLDDDIPF